MSQFDAVLPSSERLIQNSRTALQIHKQSSMEYTQQRQHIHSDDRKEHKTAKNIIFKLKQMLMVCLFSMCSRGVEGHENDKFFIYKTCEKGDSENMGLNLR